MKRNRAVYVLKIVVFKNNCIKNMPRNIKNMAIK